MTDLKGIGETNEGVCPNLTLRGRGCLWVELHGGTVAVKSSAIALTAYAGEFDHQQAIAAGFQTHMTKPVEPDQLIEAIAALVQPNP
ncbi:hypothetical protein [Phormidium tenue]|uniref:hypothetical protein n=1 Tax=Phormidium tenue TaxID=126344 RepID=UPI0016895D1A|nr:hypothetical protein [Phormidium tenue]MBD2234440.1 hypothetical protein [Phormidium tenue FACHB-1052]